MATGYLALVLHAHLPFVRHPEHARHLEERWLYEALIECYLPLLDAFDRLADEGVPFALTMSVTPPLAAMMKDDLLRERFEEHLARLEALAEHEMKRLWGDERFAPVATFYRDAASRGCGASGTGTSGDVVAGLVRHWDAGRLELLTCSATHCYLPGMLPAREGIRPQLELGVRGFERLVGAQADGRVARRVRLPPELRRRDRARAGIRFTLVDTHGILNARPRPPFGVHAPIVLARAASRSSRATPSRAGRCGRATRATRATPTTATSTATSASTSPRSELMGEVAGDGSRLMTGLKYYRITGKDVDEAALPCRASRARSASEHAGNFVFNRAAQVTHLRRARCRCRPSSSRRTTRSSTATGGSRGRSSSRRCSASCRKTNGELEPITLRGYLDRHPVCRAGDAERELLGRGRLRRGLGGARGRRGRGGTCTTRRATCAGS